MPATLAPLELARLLRRRVAGEPFPHSFIHEVDACSVDPEELVRGRAPGADQGDGKGIAWYFYGPANCYEGPCGESARRRRRQVRGGGDAGAGRRCWHPETGKKPILGPDKKSVVAYKRTLSYVLKIKNLPVKAKPFRNKRLGWCMIEIGLEKRDDGEDDQQQLLCKVYKSPRTDPETSTGASPVGRPGVHSAAISAVSSGGGTQDEALHVPGPGNDMQPTSGDYNLHPPRLAQNPALFIGPGSDMPPASGQYNLHPPGVVQNPAFSIGPAPQYGTQCWPGGQVLSRVAIVKKADVASSESVTVVMKFGSSSIPSAERIKEMAKLVLNFPSDNGEIRAVVLSGMGSTTNNILMAVWKALRCGDQKASEIHEFVIIKELYLRMIDELGLQTSIVSDPLDKLEHHLQHVAITKELTPRTRDYLVSFGDHMSTIIFFGYLNKLGKATPQEWELRAVTTSGSGSSDWTATTIGKALGLRQIQVWKDVDGILTCDPKVCATAMLVPYLTFDEAAELGYFSEQSRLAIIMLKSNITMLEIERISMLSRNAFVAKAFLIFQEFEDLGISVNFVAEGKMSFTLVPSKLLSQESIQLAIDNVVEELKKIASVDLLQNRSVISLIGNTQMATLILQKAVNVLRSIKTEAQKVWQSSSKLVTKTSLVVDDREGVLCVQALHSAFFEINDDFLPVRVDSPAADSSSGVKERKAASDDQPSASQGLLQESAYITDPSTSVVERTIFPGNDPIMLVGGDNNLAAPGRVVDGVLEEEDYYLDLVHNRVDDFLCADEFELSWLADAFEKADAFEGQEVIRGLPDDTTGANYMSPEETDRLWSPYNGPMPRRIRLERNRMQRSSQHIEVSRTEKLFAPDSEELFPPPEHPEVSLSIAGSLAKELFAAIRWLAGCWATCRKRIGV